MSLQIKVSQVYLPTSIDATVAAVRPNSTAAAVVPTVSVAIGSRLTVPFTVPGLL